jgi:nucleotide-binding universal stress UspA family protein
MILEQALELWSAILLLLLDGISFLRSLIMPDLGLTISRILVPVDFSDRCLGMMPYVKVFSERYDAEVILLHVVDPIYTIPATGISPPVTMPEPQWLLDQRSAQLETFGSAALTKLPVRRFIYEGDPESQIAATAQSEQVGLVIMPTHGRGVFRRFLIGSVTAKVLHDVHCPVLTGAHIQDNANGNATGISNVVCAIDPSRQSEEILTAALSLAEVFNAKLRIVHVAPRSDPTLRAHSSSGLRDQLKEIVKTQMARMRPVSAVDNPEISIEEGEVAHGVAHFAKSSGADLVVVGRGSGEAERLRTNTYSIIRQSPCPVLSI